MSRMFPPQLLAPGALGDEERSPRGGLANFGPNVTGSEGIRGGGGISNGGDPLGPAPLGSLSPSGFLIPSNSFAIEGARVSLPSG